MAALNEGHLEGILLSCAGNAAALTESLNQCFDSSFRIGTGDSLPWSPDDIPLVFDAPGLATVFAFGSQSVVCLVPESLALPDWYTRPNDSQQSRLQTLAMEWSMNMLPAELEAESFRTVPCANLKRELERGGPAEWAAVLLLPVFAAGAGENDPAGSHILLVAPLEKPAFAKIEPAASPPPQRPAAAAPSIPPKAAPARTRPARILHLPVTISVRLAEKRIETGQLLSIAPGALITFNKSCEDLLDLYVNNHRYCRGEAVKIGEKFGLKINEVGVENIRETKVLV